MQKKFFSLRLTYKLLFFNYVESVKKIKYQIFLLALNCKEQKIKFQLNLWIKSSKDYRQIRVTYICISKVINVWMGKNLIEILYSNSILDLILERYHFPLIICYIYYWDNLQFPSYYICVYWFSNPFYNLITTFL